MYPGKLNYLYIQQVSNTVFTGRLVNTFPGNTTMDQGLLFLEQMQKD